MLRIIPRRITTNISLPNLWVPVPEPPVQIPYVPDFWDSSAPLAAQPVDDDPLPKLLVVAGADTHLSGGPSHNLHDPLEHHAPPIQPAPTKEGGLWDDVADDIGIPRPKQVQNAFWRVFSS